MIHRTIFLLLAACALCGCRTSAPVAQPATTGKPGYKTCEAVVKFHPIFKSYDGVIVAAAEKRWFDLLDEHHYDGKKKGHVVLKFKLHPDGSISEPTIVKNTGDPIFAELAQKAVQDSTPFAPWPEEIRQEIKENYRTCTFNFEYN